MTVHHIVYDGWSEGVLIAELTALYKAALAGRPSPLGELAVQYADFAAWQRAWPPSVLGRQLAYWRDELRGAPAALPLPVDRPGRPRRPGQAAPSFSGASAMLRLPAATAAALRQAARREGTTLYMLLLAGFAALLSRVTGEEDLLVGTPVADRPRPEVFGLIGFFVNTLVIRARAAGDPSFRRLLAAVRDTALSAFAHQDLPFEMLVEELRPERERSRNPLVQALFSFQGAGQGHHAGLRHGAPPRAAPLGRAVDGEARPPALGDGDAGRQLGRGRRGGARPGPGVRDGPLHRDDRGAPPRPLRSARRRGGRLAGVAGAAPLLPAAPLRARAPSALRRVERHGVGLPAPPRAPPVRGAGGGAARRGGRRLGGRRAHLRRARPARRPRRAPAAAAGSGCRVTGRRLRRALGGAGRRALGRPQGGRRLPAARPGLSARAAGAAAGGRRAGGRGGAAAPAGGSPRYGAPPGARGRLRRRRRGCRGRRAGRRLHCRRRCRRASREPRLRALHLGLDGRAQGGRGQPWCGGAAGARGGLRVVRPRRGLPPAGADVVRPGDLRDLGAAPQRRPAGAPAAWAVHAGRPLRGGGAPRGDDALADLRPLPPRGGGGARPARRPAPAPRRRRRPVAPPRAAGARGPAGGRPHQRLRPDGEHDVLDHPPPARWARGGRDVGADRAADRRQPRLRARPLARAAAGRKRRGALRGRRRRGARLPRPPGADRRALSAGSVLGGPAGPQGARTGSTARAISRGGGRTGRSTSSAGSTSRSRCAASASSPGRWRAPSSAIRACARRW